MRRKPNMAVIILGCLLIYILFVIAGMEADAAYDERENICPYRYLILTYEQENELAQLVYTECGSLEYCGKGDAEEGRRCYIATFQVVLNRYMSERFMGDEVSIYQIIHNRTQFAAYPNYLYSDPPDWVYDIMYDTLMGEDLQLPYYVCFYSLGLNPGTIAYQRIGAHLFAYRECDK